MDGQIAAGTALASAGALAGAAAWAVRAPSSSLLAPSIYRGPSDRPAIAITFDDGPSESTPVIQQVLEVHGAQATFFACGIHVRRLPEVTRCLARAGHEIANHTDTHASLWLRSPQFIYNELARAQASIEEVTGQEPALFRAPYGVRWPGLRSAQRRLNLMGVMWTDIGLDWKLTPPDIAARLLKNAANGSIFCLHDGRGVETNPNISATVEAVRLVLPELLARGYRLVTVSELLRIE